MGDPEGFYKTGNSLDDVLKREYLHLDKNEVDKYTKIHKEFTRKLLNIAYPNQDKLKLYRGTTTREVVGDGEDVEIQSNPLSSWTTKKDVAKEFADNSGGIILESEVSKDSIWSSYMSHAIEGGVREFLVITPHTRKGKVIYGKSTMKSDKKATILLDIDNNFKNVDWLRVLREKFNKAQNRWKKKVHKDKTGQYHIKN